MSIVAKLVEALNHTLQFESSNAGGSDYMSSTIDVTDDWDFDGPINYLSGLLDEVAFYDRALAPSEILALATVP